MKTVELPTGAKVLCIKSVYQQDDNELLYMKGEKYKCFDGDSIKDIRGEKRCWAQWPTSFHDHFEIIEALNK